MEYVLYFFAWTFVLYWTHRICHLLPFAKDIHWQHHKYVDAQQPGWMWQNMFLWSDDWGSTADLWLTEVVPTLIFCYFTGQWWIFGIYYVWTAFIQEFVEHNPKFDFPLLSAGKCHLNHHTDWKCNYSLFFPIWDIVFGTYKAIEKK